MRHIKNESGNNNSTDARVGQRPRDVANIRRNLSIAVVELVVVMRRLRHVVLRLGQFHDDLSMFADQRPRDKVHRRVCRRSSRQPIGVRRQQKQI